MRINLLSSFAAGLLIATTICGVAYYSNKSDTPKASAKNINYHTAPSEKEMKKQLETKGYVVETKAEYDKKMKTSKTAVKKQTAPEDNKPSKTVTRVIVNVSEGMTSIDVGNMLVKANLVPNAYNFSTDIEKKGLQNNLRPGVFVVDSEMTYDQIITTIFQ